MDQASQLFVSSDLDRQATRNVFQMPCMVLHFAVAPGATFAWRAPNHAEIRSLDELVWLTRARNAGDYWIGPGQVVRVRRGERIWISTDGPQGAEVSITMRYPKATRGWLARCCERVSAWFE